MNREESLAWLYGLQKLGIKLGLENIRTVCGLLENPERTFESVLVAGTNGKGSVSAMLDSILSDDHASSGSRSGLYTSPHLVRPEERIRIGGHDIEPPRFEEALARVRRIVDRGVAMGELSRHPTFFEVMTAMAFEAFRRAEVRIAVLEVGLGGRFDATNVTLPRLSIVSGIDLDHQEQLGPDLTSIAREKSGVFREGRPALVGEEKLEPLAALREAATAARATLVHVPSEVRATVLDDGLRTASGNHRLHLDLVTPVRRYADLELPLPGSHQARNVALAVRAAEILGAGEQAIRRGLASTRWGGRLEWVAGAPPLLLDCAHNPAGAAALARALSRVGPERCVLVFGAMRDKDFAGMSRELAGAVRAVVATRPRVERAATEQDVLTAFRAAAASRSRERADESGGTAPTLLLRAVADVAEALSAAKTLAGPSGVVCVAGSIFLVGEVKELLERPDEEARRLGGP